MQIIIQKSLFHDEAHENRNNFNTNSFWEKHLIVGGEWVETCVAMVTVKNH